MNIYTLKIYYKYRVETSFFEEIYKNLTLEQAYKISERYGNAMKNGDYVALTIKWDTTIQNGDF